MWAGPDVSFLGSFDVRGRPDAARFFMWIVSPGVVYEVGRPEG
jgi:hypothetical protein